ncbi:MAG: hypothetical protein V3T86_01220 [Planctomycetota bacterium]
MRNLSLAFAPIPVVLIAIAALGQEPAESDRWHVELPAGKATLLVDPEMSATSVRERAPAKAPKQDRWAGGEKIQLENLAGVNQLVTGRDKRTPSKPLTKEKKSIRMFRAGPVGRVLAYAIDGTTAKRMKASPRDLVLLDLETGARLELLTGKHIMDFAFSPDGKVLAVSHSTQIDFYDRAGKLLRTLAAKQIDKRMYSHGAHHILWRPDSAAIACAIQFLGGRVAIAGEEPTPIYGDHQLFIVPLKGAVKAIDLPENAWVKPVAWHQR